jgi:hypothetical protein
VRWVIERWATIKAAVADKRHAIDGIVGLGIALLDWAARSLDWWPLRAIPHWFVWAFIVACLLVWWLLNYANKLRVQATVSRVALAKLRADGVPLRNQARLPIKDQKQWEEWRAAVTDWNDRVIAEIRKLSEADAIWFSVLDAVPQPRVYPERNNMADPYDPPWDQERMTLFVWHDFRLLRLDQMIQSAERR